MERVTGYLEEHHAHCDEWLAAAETAADDGRWTACTEAMNRLERNLEAHFATEERILFPAFEFATGMCDGPTAVMRMEHGQMREILRRLSDACAGAAAADFVGAAETLLVLIGQHNMKEQNILYPMCDRALQAQSATLTAALRGGIEGSPCAASGS